MQREKGETGKIPIQKSREAWKSSQACRRNLEKFSGMLGKPGKVPRHAEKPGKVPRHAGETWKSSKACWGNLKKFSGINVEKQRQKGKKTWKGSEAR